MKTAVINTFMRVYYDTLKQNISDHGMLEEDVFHDTYLALLQAPEMVLTPKMFKSVYRYLLRRKLSSQYVFCVPSELFFQRLVDNMVEDAPQQEEEVKDTVTAATVKLYAKTALNPKEYTLFVLRFVKGYTLQQTGEYIGCTAATAMRRADAIRTQIYNHFITAAI